MEWATIRIGDRNSSADVTITDSSPEKTGAVLNTGTHTAWSDYHNYAIAVHSYSTVTIENARVASENDDAIFVYGRVTVKDGAVIEGYKNAFDVTGYRNLVIEGGTIKGGQTFSQASNMITINGGAFSDDMGNDASITRPDGQILIKDEADGLYRLGKNVTVTFDANGGSGYMANVATNTLHEYVLPTCTFTPPSDSYFAGWKIDDTDTVYEEGAEVALTGDTTVVAQWNTYHFDLYVQGIRVSRTNCQDVLGDLDGDAATVSYDIENNTLVLDGANIEAGRMEDYAARYVYGYEYGIRADMGEDFKIELRGSNTIGNASFEEDTNQGVFGISYIWNSKGLITGTGTLSIDFDSADSGLMHAGIQDMAYQGGGMTIDGATVNIGITGSS